MSIVDHVRSIYDRLIRGDVDDLVKDFADDGWYNRIPLGETAKGRLEIREALASWRMYFKRLQMHNLEIQEIAHTSGSRLADRRDERSDAVHFVEVTYFVTGIYARTLPGLELKAPANGQDAKMCVKEHLWLNELGLIVRADITFNLRELDNE